jgi:hypothetical protein
VASRSKVWVYGRSLSGIVGSNPTYGMDVCLLWVLCVVSATSWSLVQRSPTECGVSKSVIAKPRKMRRPRPPRGCRATGKKKEVDRSLVDIVDCPNELMLVLADYAITWLVSGLVDGWLVVSFWAFAAAQLRSLFFGEIAPRHWCPMFRDSLVFSSSRVVCPILHWTFDQSPRSFVSLSESSRCVVSRYTC